MELKYKNYSLAVLIPMYNEEEAASVCIEKVMEVLQKLKYPSKLIVVNDGSSDKTEKILKEKKEKYKNYLIILTHKKNKGYGSALQTGVTEAQKGKFAWVLYMDSDLTNDPKYIYDFSKYIQSEYDCVKASRYIKGGIVENVPIYRRIISIIGNYMASFLFRIGIKDCTNGFRMVRLSKLKNIRFKENSFAIILEELLYLKKNHAGFVEIPYILTARKDSLSHFSYKPKVFYTYFKYALESIFIE